MADVNDPGQGANATGSGTDDIDDILGDEGVGTPSSDASDDDSGEQSFYDASKVPDELRPTFREMQGTLTKKTQMLSAKTKELQSREQKLDDALYRAGLFDQLMQDERVTGFLKSIDGRGGNSSQGSDDYSDSETDSKIESLQRTVDSLQGQLVVDREREQFTRANPDWEQYKDGMTAAWGEDRKAGRALRSFQSAYDAAFRVSMRDRLVAARKRRDASEASVEGSSSGATALSTKPAKNWDDAVRAALAEHNMTMKDLTRPGL